MEGQLTRITIAVASLAVAALTFAAAGARPLATVGGPTCQPSWRIVAHKGVPNLDGVVALSPKNVWAVGGRDYRTGAQSAVIAHWDGRKVTTKTFAVGDSFSGVGASSAHDIWVVGGISAHFDGRNWKRLAFSAADVAAVAPDDVWAVGIGKAAVPVMHWDGRRWSNVDIRAVAPARSLLNAIDAASADDVWAVGGVEDARSSYGDEDVVLRWDGRSWRHVDSPLASVYSGATAYALDIGRSGDVWTVNDDLSGNGPFFVHWQGRARSHAAVTEWDLFDRSGSVNDIGVVSPTEVWTVGEFGEDTKGREVRTPLVGRWSGRAWRVQATPFDKLAGTSLNAISVVSKDDIWAVGDHLIARYSCRGA